MYAAAKGWNVVGAFGGLSPLVKHFAIFKIIEDLTSFFSSSKHFIFVTVIPNGVFFSIMFSNLILLIERKAMRFYICFLYNCMYVMHDYFDCYEIYNRNEWENNN